MIDLAHALGWIVAHFRAAKTERGWRTPVQADGNGFPDLVMSSWRQGRVVYAELKSNNGKLSPEQQMWISHLEHAGQEAYTWRPCDWDQIVRILQSVGNRGLMERSR